MVKPQSIHSGSKRQATHRYLSVIILLIALIVSSSFLGFTYRTEALFDTLLLEQARAFDKEITLVRRWVWSHGGIYVLEGGSPRANPRVITSLEGRTLRQLNSAEVTSQLSRFSHESGIVAFSSISLSPLNPMNQPDDFERAGIARFREGAARELYEYQQTDDGLLFRYMSPVKTRKGCLKCHTDGSYEPGRIDSALSYSIPADAIAQDKQRNKVWMAISGILIIGIAVVSIWLLARRFVTQLAEADQRLEEMATQDRLTGLLNRAMGMDLLDAELSRAQRSGNPVCVALMDIDHFKRINDSMGHLAGDDALRKFAEIVRANVREYDIAFRYRGEEFVLVMPETTADHAVRLSDRLRQSVEDQEIETSAGPLKMTISIGIAQFSPGMSADNVLANADEALYQCKQNGRNRCTLHAQK